MKLGFIHKIEPIKTNDKKQTFDRRKNRNYNEVGIPTSIPLNNQSSVELKTEVSDLKVFQASYLDSGEKKYIDIVAKNPQAAAKALFQSNASLSNKKIKVSQTNKPVTDELLKSTKQLKKVVKASVKKVEE